MQSLRCHSWPSLVLQRRRTATHPADELGTDRGRVLRTNGARLRVALVHELGAGVVPQGGRLIQREERHLARRHIAVAGHLKEP